MRSRTRTQEEEAAEAKEEAADDEEEEEEEARAPRTSESRGGGGGSRRLQPPAAACELAHRAPPLTRASPAPRSQPMKVHKKAGGDAKRGGAKAEAAGGFEDEELECRDCQAKFTFTVGEQEFFAQKGFDNKPVRPARVRAQRSAAAESARPQRHPVVYRARALLRARVRTSKNFLGHLRSLRALRTQSSALTCARRLGFGGRLGAPRARTPAANTR